MRDRTAEEFKVVARSREDNGVLCVWGNYAASYAEIIRSDKAREFPRCEVTVEPVKPKP